VRKGKRGTIKARQKLILLCVFASSNKLGGTFYKRGGTTTRTGHLTCVGSERVDIGGN